LEEAFRPAISKYWRDRYYVEPDWQWFQYAMKDVDLDASPGWPWKNTASTNRELFYNPDGSKNELNWKMVYAAFLDRFQTLLGKPEADDINLFIKDELHKEKKRQTEAWRLIASVGLTDCLVDRFLFGDFFNALYSYEGYTQTPNKAGWSPPRGGFSWFYKRYRGRKVLMADKSSWDWTVQGWIVEVLTEFMVRVCARDDENLERLIRNRMMCIFRLAMFNVGGYNRFMQAVCGIMKSGCLGTIAWNGFGQLCCHLLAVLRERVYGEPPDVMGDDTVQEIPHYLNGEDATPVYLDAIMATGAIVKEFQIADTCMAEPIEFAGTKFTVEFAIPAYREKHIATLMTFRDDEIRKSMLESYVRLYAFDDYFFPRLNRWLLDLGGESISRAYAKDWYLGYSLGMDDYYNIPASFYE
jgi:hypothetical protein